MVKSTSVDATGPTSTMTLNVDCQSKTIARNLYLYKMLHELDVIMSLYLTDVLSFYAINAYHWQAHFERRHRFVYSAVSEPSKASTAVKWSSGEYHGTVSWTPSTVGQLHTQWPRDLDCIAYGSSVTSIDLSFAAVVAAFTTTVTSNTTGARTSMYPMVRI
jgi:hypothetical protein